MKILTIVENLGIGGTERVAQNFAISYKLEGNDSKVLVTKSKGLREFIIAKHNIEIIDGSQCVNEAIKKINEWAPQIIHIHRPGYRDSLNELLQYIKKPGTKVVETNIFARPDYSTTANLIDVHLLLTKWCLWKWQNWTKGLNQLGVVIPNPVETTSCQTRVSEADKQAIKKKFNIPQNAFVLGRVGQKINVKWNEMVLRLFQKLLNECNPDFYLVLLGCPNEMIAELEKYSENVKTRVILVDYISNDTELNQLYSIMDIFVHASKIGESFGMVLAEAQLNRIPVITLSTPLKDNSQVELIKNNQTGYVVNDFASFYEAIIKLYNDETLRKKFGDSGFNNISASYATSLVTKKLLKLFTILTDKNNKTILKNILTEKGYTTFISNEEINVMKNNYFGRGYSKLDTIKSKILHSKSFYQTYLKIKSVK